MRSNFKMWLTVIALSASITSVAQAAQWRCAAYDSTHRAYVVNADSIDWAMKQSFKTCLKLSPYKRSCTISASSCTQAVPRHHRHHCVVADARGRVWTARGYHACAKAVSQCRQWHFNHGIPNGGICEIR